ncbi:MAG TPA: hypothetical protein VMM84_08500 [Pyrinomonadaceae bacterium]|nr:hypothetical protein [Pyrinomonadaceae bacterium]
MIHRSKRDWWLVAIVMAAVIVPLVFGVINLLVPGGNPQAGWLMVLTSTAAAAVLLGFAHPVYYMITDFDLVVRSGFLQYRVPLASIVKESFKFSRMVFGQYRKGTKTRYLLISPEDKTAFLRELASSDAGLEVHGDRVIRAA